MAANAEYAILVLKQFQSHTFVEFGDVQRGRTKERCIIIRNPESDDVSVVMMAPKSLHGDSFNGTLSLRDARAFEREFVIPAEGEEVVRLAWGPEVAGSIREIVNVRASLIGTGRNFTVNLCLIGSCPAPPPPKKKKVAAVRPRKKVLGLHQEGNSAAPRDSQATFAIPTGPAPQARNTTYIVTGRGGGRQEAQKENGQQREEFRPGSCPEGEALLSRHIPPTQSPRRETYVVHTKTTTVSNSREVRTLSPVKRGGGVEMEEEVFVSQAEESFVEKHTTVEVEEDACSYRPGGMKRSLTYDVDIPCASGSAPVFEAGPGSPLNSTVAPTGEAAKTSFFPEDVHMSAIAPNNPRRHALVVQTPSGDVQRHLTFPEDGPFLKPPPPSFSTGGKKKGLAKKRLEMQAPSSDDDEEEVERDLRRMGGGDNDGEWSCFQTGGTSQEEEDWVRQQDLGFSGWLNSVLRANFDVQDHDARPEDAKVLSREAARKLLKKMESEGGGEPAPSKEVVSLKLYSDLQKQRELRATGKRIWTDLEPLIKKFDQALIDKKFSMRPDRQIHADTGLRIRMLEVLSCVHPLWLRLGLETVYGEILPMNSLEDRAELLGFVAKRLLSDPETLRRHTHPTLKAFIREKETKEEMGRFFLQRFVHLLIFLDTAKVAGIIKHDPCLFLRSKQSAFKSILDLFQVLISEYMSGGGNVLKFLSRHGYTPTHKQTELDEYRYSVSRIGADLRDGVILTRVVRLLTGDTDSSNKVLVPAVDIRRKTRNVELAFEALMKANFNLSGLKHQHIVTGSREKTLELLWRLVLHFQIRALFPVKEVKEEVERLERSLSAEEQQEVVSLRVGLPHFESEEICLLFEWVQLVCLKKGVQIRNFHRSFVDGQAVCSIVAFYLPWLVSESDDPRDRWGFFNQAMKRIGGVPRLIGAPSGEGRSLCEKMTILSLSILCGRLMAFQRETRAALICQRAFRRRLLWKRLDALLIDHRSARKIQRKWRATLAMRKQRQDYLLQLEQRRKERESAKVIQRSWRGAGLFLCRFRRAMRDHRAAIVLQAAWRGQLTRGEMKKRKESTIKMQALIRMKRERRAYLRTRKAAVFVQKNGRMLAQRRRFLQMREEKREEARREGAVTTIQSWARMWRARNHYLRHKEDMRRTRLLQQIRARKARKVQDWYRRILAERRRRNAAAVKVASVMRMRRDRIRFLILKEAVKEVEGRRAALLKMREERSAYRALRAAVIWIQATFRMSVERKKFLVWREERNRQRRDEAAVLIQSWTRVVLAKRELLRLRQRRLEYLDGVAENLRCHLASIKIQRVTRVFLADRRAQRELHSVLVIQTWWRCRFYRMRFLRLRASVVLVQRSWRAVQCRRRLALARRSAIIIQAFWRGCSVRQRNQNMRIGYIRQRLELVSGRAEEREQLGQRTRRSLDFILKKRQLTGIRNALLELETTSRLSPESCQRICEDGGVGVLFHLMGEMNRSVACESVNAVAVRLLLNIAKYSRTAHFVVEETGWAETLVHVMVANRPKTPGSEEEGIFVGLALIFICLSHTVLAQITIAESPDIRTKFSSMLNLLQKSHDKEIRNQSQQLVMSNLDKVVGRKEAQRLLLLDKRMQDLSQSPFTPFWILKRETPTEEISPLPAVKYMRKRYGLQ